MKNRTVIWKWVQFVASMGGIARALKLGVACLLLGVGSAQAVTSFNDFNTTPDLAGAWTEYVYYAADFLTATWNSTDKDLDLVKSTGAGASGLYRTGTSRLPTDTVTMTVKSLGRSSGGWGFLALMITAVQQQDYLAGAGDSYSLVMTPVSPSSVKFAVRRTYADGTGTYQLFEGSEVAFAGPYTNQIIRVGDHYEFRSNGALLYSTAAPAAGDFYTPASKNSMVYYQIVMASDGAMTATVDDFGVPLTSDPAVTLNGSTTLGDIAGNAPAGTLVGQLSMINTDPAGFAYSLDPGGDTTHFEIPVGTSNLLVKAALGAGPYGLKIVGSNGGFAVTNDITIRMLAHIGVALSRTKMSVNATVGDLVGILSLVNALTPGDFAFSLHASGDTTHFAIPDGTSNLVTAAALPLGTYDIVVLATNATDGFWVTNGYTIAVLTPPKVINVDFGGGNNYTGASANGPIASGTTWNYFTGGNSQSKLNLTDDSGVATTVDLTFGSSGWGVSAPNTLNNLQGDYVYMTTTPGTLTISGLTPGGAYNIALITIAQATGLFATDFTINGITFRAVDIAGAGANANGPLTFSVGGTHALFSNVIADGSGVITVTVNKKTGVSNGVLSGMQIETSLTPPSTSFGVVSVDLGTLSSSNYLGAAANGPIASAGTTWNYFIGDNGKSQWHLTNDTGVATSVDVTCVSGWSFFADNVPNNLQGDRGYTSGGPATFQISGLKPGRAYNLALITMGYSTDFSIGATTNNANASANAGSNANGPLTFTAGVTHALFTGITAGSNGSITFTTAKAAGSSYGVLAGFQIQESPPSGTLFSFY